jgi:opacity protein-like surface antigen
VKRLFLLAAAALLLTSGTAAAQVSDAGGRIGFSVDPDQFAMGGQLEFGPFERNFMIVPSLELGVGDHVTTIQPNIDVDYHFDVHESWNPYAGFGLGIAFYDWGSRYAPFDGSDTEVGANLIGGLRFRQVDRRQIFTEMRIGVGDIPSLKILAGMNFSL